VKFDPAKTLYEVNILAKINNTDNIDYNPGGYQLGFRVRDGNMCVNSGLETDKGDFVNWGGCVTYDTLWHHVAFTYDAKASLNNFKTYLDGKLVVQNTVTGRIIPGQGLLIIGSRAGIDTNAKYELDDIRLWSRVLTQEELMKNQIVKLTGKEEGLKLFLSFDDSFKDISGNGNDAIPINYGKLVSSKFSPPVTAFDFYRSLNEVSFHNQTTNGESYFWDFGNKTTSVLGNPKYVYPAAGEYLVSLTASNKTTVTATMGSVTIDGLNRVEPASSGNKGYCNLLIYGGGLKVTGTTVLLRKTGNADITGETLYSPAAGVLSVEMNLENAMLGKWNVVVKNGTAEMVMKDAFEIIKAEQADPWVTLSGRGAILFNRWQSYRLSFGNNGNVDAHSVPVWFAITDDDALEVEFIDFEMVVPDLAIQKGIGSQITALGPYFKTDLVNGENMKARVYPFMVPNIPAKSSGSVHIRIKTAKSFQMKVWANPPWVEVAGAGKSAFLKSASFQAKRQTAECVMGVIAEGVVDIGTSAIPGVGCLWSAGKWAYQTASNPPWGKKSLMMNSLWNACVAVADCGINLSGVGAIYKGLGVFMANMGGYIKNYNDCLELMKANSSQNMGVSAVSSFDPNEISGPKGYGNENWIQKNSMIPYTIQFENKSTATAPAHTVTITDTLDLSKFNLRDFSFGSFGWGDTLRVPTGKFLKEFSVDVDLRPGKNLITRVSGKLDTITGIIRWDFLSLNPTTMEIEDDPFLGFLPPNNSSNQGEGFVSYSVGLKPELKTNAKIRNRASIVFDANKPILTNEYVNTLDIDVPQSSVFPLDATIDSRFPVTWAGSDIGSGVRNYSVFVLENDTLLSPWLINTTLTTSDFEGKVGSKYKFYSQATDNVSLNEAESGYDAQTTVTVFSEEFDLIRDELLLYPNPASGTLKVQLLHAPCGMYVMELTGINGTLYYSALHDSYDLTSGLGVDIRNYPPGNYIVRIIYGNRSVSRNIAVR
jgi:PKD repeat protein